MAIDSTTVFQGAPVEGQAAMCLVSIPASDAAAQAAADALQQGDFGLKQAERNPPLEFPTDMRRFDQTLSSAVALTGEVFAKLGSREEVLKIVEANERRNAPCAYASADIQERKKVSSAVIGEEKKTVDSSTSLDKVMDYPRLCTIDLSLKDKGIKEDSQYILDAAGMTMENFCERYLTEVKEGGSIRILEPGNNDQTTPIVLADAIVRIQQYLASKGIHNVSIEVLALGQGGHATTELFDQIGHVNGDAFAGVAEADSLGDTLRAALMERGVMTTMSDMGTSFGSTPKGFTVEIKKENRSRNTGQNVQAAAKAWSTSSDETDYFVIAATTANRRQVQTFAHQMAVPYRNMIGLPMVRSGHFVSTAFDDKALVTECLAGLAERARSFAYMFAGKEGYIPLSRLDHEDLASLYQIYSKLSGKTQEEAFSTPIGVVQTFFSEKFGVMEKAITENTFQADHARKIVDKIHSILAKFSKGSVEAARGSPGLFQRFFQVLTMSPVSATV